MEVITSSLDHRAARRALDALHQSWTNNASPAPEEAEAYERGLRSIWQARGFEHSCDEPKLPTVAHLRAWCRCWQERFHRLDLSRKVYHLPPIAGQIRFAWQRMRELSNGEPYPPEPPDPEDFHEAVRAFDPVIAWCSARLQSATAQSIISVPLVPIAPHYHFRLEGQMWSVRFGAESGFFPRDFKGLGYLAKLLASPGKAITALELMGANQAHGVRSVAGVEQFDSDEPVGLGGSDDPVLDKRARKDYRRRMQELTEEIREARENNDFATEEKLQREFDFLVQDLKQASGLGQHDRHIGPTAEDKKAVDAVRKALNRAYDRLAAASPPMNELVTHLKASIKAEVVSYTYHPVSALNWQF